MSAVRLLVERGTIPSSEFPEPEIADTKSPEHGDYATNFALVAAKGFGMNPRELAIHMATQLGDHEAFETVEVAGPGFVNFRCRPTWLASRLATVVPGFEKSVSSEAKKINVEFVSVNPNGPITVGSGRGAAFGSTLCNVLAAAGHTVHREYYINDGVNSEQMRLFADSIQFFLSKPFLPEKSFPEKGYKGDYVEERAEDLRSVMQQWKDAQERQVKVGEVMEWSRPTPGPRSPMVATKGGITVRLNTEHVSRLGTWVASFATTANKLLHDQGAPRDALRHAVEQLMIASQRSDLATFGVEFDTWFSEQSLHDAGQVEACIRDLESAGTADARPFRTQLKMAKGGKVEEATRESQIQEGSDEADTEGEGEQPTLWLRSTKFGDDQDRVLRRRDGRLTYIASDVAYHKDKFNRPADADKLITILGPDHHGYIGRLTAVVAALLAAHSEPSKDGGPLNEWASQVYESPEERDRCRAALEEAKRKLEVVIFQIVRFVKEGKPAPMRKRDGNIYALIDLVREIGKNTAPEADEDEQTRIGRDVARFFYLMRSHETHMDFDIDLATKQNDENPVFYVQYAHARICQVVLKAREAGFEEGLAYDASLLTHPREIALMKKVYDLPYEVQRCAEDYGVHRLTTYAVELARTFHHFYDACRVVQPESPEQSRARLALCIATRTGLKSVFDLLGISAPERMDR